jgi:hypothetical protein
MRRAPRARAGATIAFAALLSLATGAFGQERELEKGQVSALAFSFYAPGFVLAELDRWIPGFDVPWQAQRAAAPIPSLGFLFIGQWEKGLILGGIDAAFVAASFFARPYFPLSTFARMPASHLAFYTDYELYKDARLLADPASYRYPLRPLSMPQAALAPFRFDFLSDPFVSISLACQIIGAWAVNHFTNGPFEAPGDPFVWYGTEYPGPGGIALYLTELAYRSYWAAVAEEAAFRGFLLPEMTEALAPILGCVANGLYFALAHYGKDQDFGNFMLNALYSFIPTGIYFAYLSYREDFDFRKAAFAHFWYDVSLGVLYLFYGDTVTRQASIYPAPVGRGIGLSFNISI